MGTNAYATVLVLLAVLLGGCLGDVAPPPGPTDPADARAALTDPVLVLVDPEGDATEHNSDQAAAAARQACQLVHTSQRAACRAAIPEERTGGTPAPGALDLVSLHVQESADEIVFRIGLAELSDDVAQFVDATGQYGAIVTVGYRSGTSCTGSVTFRVEVVPDAIYAQAHHSRSHDACEPEPGDPLQGRCTTWMRDCVVAVPWRVEPGTPGALVISVPRAQTALMATGTDIEADARVLRMTSQGIPGGYVHPGTHLGTGQFSFDARIHMYIVDDTPWGTFTLSTPGRADAWGETSSVTLIKAAAGTIAEGDLDLQSLALADDARNFTITMTLRELDQAPDNLDFIWQFTTPGKHHYGVFGSGDGGEWEVSALRALPDRSVPIAAEISAQPGSPGTVTITIPRTELPGTSEGELTRAFFGGMQRATQERHDGPAGAFHLTAFTQTGVLVQLPPYRFASDAAEAAALPAIEITDAVGDTQVPPEAAADPAFRASRFDLAYATLRAVTDQRVRLDLGVVGLDAVVVPTLYEGAFYGAGLQTEKGAWMVALIQDQATGTPAAICGPDIAFLTADPKPPTAAAGVPISYTLIPSSGDAAGLLTFDVPAACLGIEDATPVFPVSRLAARTGLIGNPVSAVSSSPVTIIDEALDTQGGRLVFPQAAAALPSPWAEPFGIENFWDMLGVALAILLVAVTATFFLARRVRMKRYLVRIEDFAEMYHDDPKRYAEELVGLRKRVFEDMLSNRITEGHFVMIEERLRGHLSSTRINAFGRAFYRLPPAFMIRLQSLLADGRFSQQDHRALTELLEEIKIPADARAAVQAQIDLWAAQDRTVAKMTRLARSRRGWRRLLPRRIGPGAEAAE